MSCRMYQFICPGHVTAITGTNMYEPIVDKFKAGCVISGFEPLDMLKFMGWLRFQYY